MRKLIRMVVLVAAVLILTSLNAGVQPAFAQSGVFSDNSLKGSWGLRFTGELLPLPIFKPEYAGPFVRTARMVADGRGNLTATAFANYAGHVQVDDYSGTYSVAADGTVTVKVFNLQLNFLNTAALPFPYSGNNAITFFGVLEDNGKEIDLMVTGIELEGFDAGALLGNIGSVISGHAIRQ